jgi:hypothetical protein
MCTVISPPVSLTWCDVFDEVSSRVQSHGACSEVVWPRGMVVYLGLHAHLATR